MIESKEKHSEEFYSKSFSFDAPYSQKSLGILPIIANRPIYCSDLKSVARVYSVDYSGLLHLSLMTHGVFVRATAKDMDGKQKWLPKIFANHVRVLLEVPLFVHPLVIDRAEVFPFIQRLVDVVILEKAWDIGALNDEGEISSLESKLIDDGSSLKIINALSAKTRKALTPEQRDENLKLRRYTVAKLRRYTFTLPDFFTAKQCLAFARELGDNVSSHGSVEVRIRDRSGSLIFVPLVTAGVVKEDALTVVQKEWHALLSRALSFKTLATLASVTYGTAEKWYKNPSPNISGNVMKFLGYVKFYFNNCPKEERASSILKILQICLRETELRRSHPSSELPVNQKIRRAD